MGKRFRSPITNGQSVCRVRMNREALLWSSTMVLFFQDFIKISLSLSSASAVNHPNFYQNLVSIESEFISEQLVTFQIVYFPKCFSMLF